VVLSGAVKGVSQQRPEGEGGIDFLSTNSILALLLIFVKKRGKF